MSAPDRIWAWPEDGAEDGLIYACEKDELEFACEKYGLVPAGTFLASTPAREHADELVGMVGDLIRVASSSSYKHAKEDTLSRARAVLSKLDQ